MPPPVPDEADSDALAPPGLRGEGSAATAWLHGYVWARLARYDHAWGWWDEAEADLPARVSGSRAAALRELGLHREAERLDLAALEADGARWEHTAARIGLVADAVGRADARAAEDRLQDAAVAVDALGSELTADRQRIRLGWVEVEVALLSGRAPRADLPRLARVRGSEEVEVPEVYRAGTVHHLAKGLLFAGVVRRDLATLDRAAAIAPPSLAWAVELARADLGVASARDEAARHWQEVVPPPGFADAVARTDTARRLSWPPPPL